MPSDLPRPPYDKELADFLSMIPLPPTLTRDHIAPIRAEGIFAFPTDVKAQIILDRPVNHRDVKVPGLTASDPEITLSIFTSAKSSSKEPKPCLYFTHGGGMIIGHRFAGASFFMDVVEQNDAVAVTVEYRLAPEHPDPAPVNDCYAGLLWVASHAEELGIDLERLMIGGHSAGGGLAAGTALMARDKKGPKLCAQLLCYPMLDDRMTTVSSHQYVDEGVWSRGSDEMAWNALLGDKAGKDGVSIYAAPARATDLSGLPNTFIDCGSAELFRDEDVAYASKLWAAGVQAELHVWPGAWHAPEQLAPQSQIGSRMLSAQLDWVKRVFTVNPKTEKLEKPDIETVASVL